MPGDILIGLPSSGLHSNGYSLARKVLLERGGMKIHQRIPELGRTLGRGVARADADLCKNHPQTVRRNIQIKGAAHITGGGITGNLPRILPHGRRAVIERQSWPVPPVFELIQKIGGVAQDEMDRTFNNGLGMILIVGKKQADAVMRTITGIGERCFVIGEIRKGARGATIRA